MWKNQEHAWGKLQAKNYEKNVRTRQTWQTERWNLFTIGTGASVCCDLQQRYVCMHKGTKLSWAKRNMVGKTHDQLMLETKPQNQQIYPRVCGTPWDPVQCTWRILPRICRSKVMGWICDVWFWFTSKNVAICHWWIIMIWWYLIFACAIISFTMIIGRAMRNHRPMQFKAGKLDQAASMLRTLCTVLDSSTSSLPEIGRKWGLDGQNSSIRQRQNLERVNGVACDGQWPVKNMYEI